MPPRGLFCSQDRAMRTRFSLRPRYVTPPLKGWLPADAFGRLLRGCRSHQATQTRARFFKAVKILKLPALMPALTLGATLSFAPLASAAPDAWMLEQGKRGNDVHGFIREGKVAAHLALTSLPAPRLLIAFPAGNSAAAVWFDPLPDEAVWSTQSALVPVIRQDARGRPLHGICTEISINAASLKVDSALLSSARVVRDYQVSRVTSVAMPSMPDSVVVEPLRDVRALIWQRDRLDGAPGYFLSLTVLNGVIEEKRFVSRDQAPLRLRVVAATGEQPLTPLVPFAALVDRTSDQNMYPSPAPGTTAQAAAAPSELKQKTEQQDSRSVASMRKALTFLSFEEKTLAGSWRFNTYFGRDTLMTLAMMMPVLLPEAVEASLSSVLMRVSEMGEVAHEESIGEFAVIERMRKGQALHDAPLYDYSMSDTDLMLAPVIAAWLLDTPTARTRAAALFSATPSKLDALIRNLRHVTRLAKPLTQVSSVAKADLAAALIGSKKKHETISQWRDSTTGLGINGHYAYDVNAVLMPAALEAAARLYESGLLNSALSSADHDALSQCRQMSHRWRRDVPALFNISTDIPLARATVEGYARHINMPESATRSALEAINDTLHFPALSLDAQGRPLPVLHSDIGMLLFFQYPDPPVLAAFIAAIMRPFPAGLMTDVGMLIANPAFAPAQQWPVFDRHHYHGSVAWPWQQALLMAGISKQLARGDLDNTLREQLKTARSRLLTIVQALPSDIRAKELWSWSYEANDQGHGRFVAQPYQQFEEANPLQLWNTTLMSPFIPPQGARGQSR